MFPDAGCELVHRNVYELTVAVILSAQTTDPSVNKITPRLFDLYPDPYSLSLADQSTLEDVIKSIGLFRNKAMHLKALAQILVDKYEGQIPNNLDTLISLPGIGRKTANVILSVGFSLPGLAVDTHVHRVSIRYGVVEPLATPTETEMILKEALPQKQWGNAHHALLFFGRYHCTARSPQCDICPLRKECKYKKMNP